MKIEINLPPIYDEIINSGLRPNDRTIYTYGDIIYNPSGEDIPPELIVHEKVHMEQQNKMLPSEWWSRYLDDRYFMIDQEVEAYAKQFRYVCKLQKDRNTRAKILMIYASILAGPTYGEHISKETAYQMIKKKAGDYKNIK